MGDVFSDIPHFYGYNSVKIFIVFGDCPPREKAVPLHSISKVQKSRNI